MGFILTTHLVSGFNHLEKILVNGKDYPYIYIYIMENKKCLKAPTTMVAAKHIQHDESS